MTLEQVGWELPLVQAMQIWHGARWAEGVWTVRPGREITEEEVADIGPDFLKGIDTAEQS